MLANNMETRLIRKRKEGSWDRATLRYLRHKYGDNKRLFVILRGVYLSLCEIIEDFGDKPIIFFTKTVGSYSGCSRQVAGKMLTLLEKEGLLTKHQSRDPKTKQFFGGSVIELQDITEYVPYQKNREAVVGDPRQRVSPPSISTNTNIINKNTAAVFKKEIAIITRWAYERAAVVPNCSREAFEQAVAKAITRVGYDIVKKHFAYEDNAIAFLVNIKNT